MSILINLDRAEWTAFGAGAARVTCRLVDLSYEFRGLQHLSSRLAMTYLQYTAIRAAVTDKIIGIVGMHQAIFITLPQDLDNLVVGNLPAHAMLDTPSCHVTHEEACFQKVIAVIAGISNPMWEAT
jgi:hypothetical protein